MNNGLSKTFKRDISLAYLFRRWSLGNVLHKITVCRYQL